MSDDRAELVPSYGEEVGTGVCKITDKLHTRLIDDNAELLYRYTESGRYSDSWDTRLLQGRLNSIYMWSRASRTSVNHSRRAQESNWKLLLWATSALS
jgi:hypothetical protein